MHCGCSWPHPPPSTLLLILLVPTNDLSVYLCLCKLLSHYSLLLHQIFTNLSFFFIFFLGILLLFSFHNHLCRFSTSRIRKMYPHILLLLFMNSYPIAFILAFYVAYLVLILSVLVWWSSLPWRCYSKCHSVAVNLGSPPCFCTTY